LPAGGGDVGDLEAGLALLADGRSRSVEVDVLVNNAGVLHEGDVLDGGADDEAVADAFAVHVLGPLRLCRALVPRMCARGFGRVVNVSSGCGSFGEGLGGPVAYSVTKAAQNALTLTLAREVGDAVDVKVNAVCPGWVRTRMGGAGAPRDHLGGDAAGRWARWRLLSRWLAGSLVNGACGDMSAAKRRPRLSCPAFEADAMIPPCSSLAFARRASPSPRCSCSSPSPSLLEASPRAWPAIRCLPRRSRHPTTSMR